MKTLIFPIIACFFFLTVNTSEAQVCCEKKIAPGLHKKEIQKAKFSHKKKDHSSKHVVNKQLPIRGELKNDRATRISEERKELIKHKQKKSYK